MELLKSLNEIKIAETIKSLIEEHGIYSKNDKVLTTVKKQLNDSCNIVFFNILSSSNSSLKIMAKTVEHSYFYNYDFGSKEISLVGGVRSNVVIN